MVVLDENLVKPGDRVRYLPESCWYSVTGANVGTFAVGTVIDPAIGGEYINVRWDGFKGYDSATDYHDVPARALDWDKSHYIKEFIHAIQGGG